MRRHKAVLTGGKLSMHIKFTVVAAKIAAVHHGGGCFLRLAAAFDPTASVHT
jgi:hypothetical protein